MVSRGYDSNKANVPPAANNEACKATREVGPKTARVGATLANTTEVGSSLVRGKLATGGLEKIGGGILAVDEALLLLGLVRLAALALGPAGIVVFAVDDEVVCFVDGVA